MKLWGWTCAECDVYHDQVDGQRTERGLSIRCPTCGAIDRIRTDRQSPEVTP